VNKDNQESVDISLHTITNPFALFCYLFLWVFNEAVSISEYTASSVIIRETHVTRKIHFQWKFDIQMMLFDLHIYVVVR
jgi:hypothetical protein